MKRRGSHWLKRYLTIFIVLWPTVGMVWEEPREFRGLTFGQDVTKTIPACPSDSWQKPKKRCWELSPAGPKDAERWYWFHHFGPVGDVAVQMSGVQLNRKLVSITLVFSSQSFAELLDIFIARYGEPSEQETDEVTNAFGATFPTKIARWHGPTLSIRIRERAGKIDEGLVMISTNVWSEYLAKKRMEALKKGRDDL